MSAENAPPPELASFREMKVGDRIWIRNASEPSEFEILLADAIRQSALNDKSQSIFYTSAYSFYGSRFHVQYILQSLPSIELPYEAWVTFIYLDRDMSFDIPHPQTSVHVENENTIQNIIVNNHKYTLQKQILIVFSCKSTDFDRNDRALRGFSDMIGFLSLIVGRSIHGEELFGSYFCIDLKKFISGRLKVAMRHQFEAVIVSFRNLFEENEIDLQDDIVNAAIWFSGRAFSTKEAKSKSIFYYTAIELICGRSPINTIRKIYKRHICSEEAVDCFKRIKVIRDNVVHRGIAEDIDAELERMTQTIILDSILFKLEKANAKTALDALLQTRTQQATE